MRDMEIARPNMIDNLFIITRCPQNLKFLYVPYYKGYLFLQDDMYVGTRDFHIADGHSTVNGTHFIKTKCAIWKSRVPI